MKERIRERLFELLETDRWVEGAFPAVDPVNADEVCRLLKKFPGSILVVGSGSSFDATFNPGPETLILLTRKLTGLFALSPSDQVLEVSAGCSVESVNQKLSDAGYFIPALRRFRMGTVGGRLAGVSCRPLPNRGDGWIQSLLGLEVALPSGQIISVGSRCIKDVAGYDLRHVFIGSRGSAGVILNAVFRCRPLSEIKHFAPVEDLSAAVAPAGRIDPKWKRLFDPLGRMYPGS